MKKLFMIFFVLAVSVGIIAENSQDKKVMKQEKDIEKSQPANKEEAIKPKKELTEEDYIKALTSPDKKIKIEAINQLAKLKSKKAVKLLNKILLEDKDYEVRYNAAIALGNIKDESSIMPLGEALTNDSNPVVRYSALLSLICYKDKKIISYIEKAYNKETDPEIKNLLQKIYEKLGIGKEKK